MGTLKSGFDSAQGFPYESSSYMVYKVLYVNSFCSFHYYHHYDHCLANIVIFYYMQTWTCISLKEYIACLFCQFVELLFNVLKNVPC